MISSTTADYTCQAHYDITYSTPVWCAARALDWNVCGIRERVPAGAVAVRVGGAPDRREQRVARVLVHEEAVAGPRLAVVVESHIIALVCVPVSRVASRPRLTHELLDVE